MAASGIAVFDPEAIKVLATAYDDACAALHIINRTHPRRMILAKKSLNTLDAVSVIPCGCARRY
jgi:hypothetical protein